MPYTGAPWENQDWSNHPLISALSTGMGLMDLPGEYVRGGVNAAFGHGQLGDRLSGEELAQNLGWQNPGAFGGMLTSMATDPLMWAGGIAPALRLARGLTGVGEAAGAARAATPFLHPAAFNFGVPLAGAGLLDANKEYGLPGVDTLASGMMVAPLAHGAYGLARGLMGGRGMPGAAEGPQTPLERATSSRNIPPNESMEEMLARWRAEHMAAYQQMGMPPEQIAQRMQEMEQQHAGLLKPISESGIPGMTMGRGSTTTTINQPMETPRGSGLMAQLQGMPGRPSMLPSESGFEGAGRSYDPANELVNARYPVEPPQEGMTLNDSQRQQVSLMLDNLQQNAMSDPFADVKSRHPEDAAAWDAAMKALAGSGGPMFPELPPHGPYTPLTPEQQQFGQQWANEQMASPAAGQGNMLNTGIDKALAARHDTPFTSMLGPNNTANDVYGQFGRSKLDAIKHLESTGQYEDLERAQQIRRAMGLPEGGVSDEVAAHQLAQKLLSEDSSMAAREAPGLAEPPAGVQRPATGEMTGGGGLQGAAFTGGMGGQGAAMRNPLVAALMRSIGQMMPGAMPGGFKGSAAQEAIQASKNIKILRATGAPEAYIAKVVKALNTKDEATIQSFNQWMKERSVGGATPQAAPAAAPAVPPGIPSPAPVAPAATPPVAALAEAAGGGTGRSVISDMGMPEITPEVEKSMLAYQNISKPQQFGGRSQAVEKGTASGTVSVPPGVPGVRPQVPPEIAQKAAQYIQALDNNPDAKAMLESMGYTGPVAPFLNRAKVAYRAGNAQTMQEFVSWMDRGTQTAAQESAPAAVPGGRIPGRRTPQSPWPSMESRGPINLLSNTDYLENKTTERQLLDQLMAMQEQEGGSGRSTGPQQLLPLTPEQAKYLTEASVRHNLARNPALQQQTDLALHRMMLHDQGMAPAGPYETRWRQAGTEEWQKPEGLLPPPMTQEEEGIGSGNPINPRLLYQGAEQRAQQMAAALAQHGENNLWAPPTHPGNLEELIASGQNRNPVFAGDVPPPQPPMQGMALPPHLGLPTELQYQEGRPTQPYTPPPPGIPGVSKEQVIARAAQQYIDAASANPASLKAMGFTGDVDKFLAAAKKTDPQAVVEWFQSHLPERADLQAGSPGASPDKPPHLENPFPPGSANWAKRKVELDNIRMDINRHLNRSYGSIPEPELRGRPLSVRENNPSTPDIQPPPEQVRAVAMKRDLEQHYLKGAADESGELLPPQPPAERGSMAKRIVDALEAQSAEFGKGTPDAHRLATKLFEESSPEANIRRQLANVYSQRGMTVGMDPKEWPPEYKRLTKLLDRIRQEREFRFNLPRVSEDTAAVHQGILNDTLTPGGTTWSAGAKDYAPGTNAKLTEPSYVNERLKRQPGESQMEYAYRINQEVRAMDQPESQMPEGVPGLGQRAFAPSHAQNEVLQGLEQSVGPNNPMVKRSLTLPNDLQEMIGAHAAGNPADEAAREEMARWASGAGTGSQLQVEDTAPYKALESQLNALRTQASGFGKRTSSKGFEAKQANLAQQNELSRQMKEMQRTWTSPEGVAGRQSPDFVGMAGEGIPIGLRRPEAEQFSEVGRSAIPLGKHTPGGVGPWANLSAEEIARRIERGEFAATSPMKGFGSLADWRNLPPAVLAILLGMGGGGMGLAQGLLQPQGQGQAA